MTAATTLFEARELLVNTLYEELAASFPDDTADLSGTGFVQPNEETVVYRGDESVVLKQPDAYTLTVDNRQFSIPARPTDLSATGTQWPSSVYVNAVRESIPLFRSMGMGDAGIENIRKALDGLSEAIRDVSVTQEQLRDWTLDGDIDLFESCCDVTLPPTKRDLKEGTGSFGDDTPPLVRRFVAGTTNRRVAYEDVDVSLIVGDADAETWGILLGIDDGGTFMHPMPRSLRLETDTYDINRGDICEILGYDKRWTPETTLVSGTRYRVQGDLLMRYLKTEDVLRVFADRVVADAVSDADKETLLSDAGIPPAAREYVTVTEEGFETTELDPRIEVDTDMDEEQVRNDINAMLGDDTTLDELTELVWDAVLSNIDVASQANALLEESVAGPSENVTIPVDNHMLFITEAHEEPFSRRDATRLFDRDGRSRTYVYCPEATTITIEHREHDPITADIPEGVYLFTLQRRRQ